MADQRIAAHDGLGRTVSTGGGCRPPAPWPAAAAGPSTARCMASMRGLQDVERSISSTDCLGDGATQAPWHGFQSNRRSRRAALSFLESARPAIGLQRVQDHGGRHHRPGQRAAPGLVHAGHQAGTVPGQKRLLSAQEAFRSHRWPVGTYRAAVHGAARKTLLQSLAIFSGARFQSSSQRQAASARAGEGVACGLQRTRAPRQSRGHRMLGRPTQGCRRLRRMICQLTTNACCRRSPSGA
jgi:hypothetical protein